uniref:Uncharacterized protein n=1 Tax=Coccolithus braarudii TaxID=221442 RepID=A0A7S0QAR6_9EUKA|mmetsp:Transcript_5842/g.12785  ORF Transcript_5842/g.12785 Transcript_5842/m.12785 type:complete len:158 (+) Transcript_5842:224-697(+)
MQRIQLIMDDDVGDAPEGGATASTSPAVDGDDEVEAWRRRIEELSAMPSASHIVAPRHPAATPTPSGTDALSDADGACNGTSGAVCTAIGAGREAALGPPESSAPPPAAAVAEGPPRPCNAAAFLYSAALYLLCYKPYVRVFATSSEPCNPLPLKDL